MGLGSKLKEILNTEQTEKNRKVPAAAQPEPIPEEDRIEALMERALLSEYADIAIYDPVSDSSVMVRIGGEYQPEKERRVRYYYDNLWSRYVARNVVEEEKEFMLSSVRRSAIEYVLKERGNYSILFHVKLEERICCCQVVFMLIPESDGRMMIAFRSADDWVTAFAWNGDRVKEPSPDIELVDSVQEADTHLPDILHELRNGAGSYINAKRLNLSLDSVDVVNEDVFCNSRQILRSLSYVLEQAARATAPGGSVSVRVKQNQGVDEFTSDYLFIVRFKGSPFGLDESLTRLVKANRGTFSADVGDHGTASAILRYSFRNSGSPVKQDVIPSLNGKRALVVDNDINTCFSVSRMLNSIGMRADWIASGEEAVIRAQYAIEQDDAYHAFVIDWTVSDMSGMDTIRRIRSIIGDTKPIIMLTAYDWPEIESEARRAGVTGFCYKPLFMSELQDVLTQPYKVVKDIPAEEVQFEGLKVLVVEDNELNLELTAELLTEAGFEVSAAGNGMEAVDMVRDAESEYYDLILMDIQMPVMNGYEAARLIRSLPDPAKAATPIVAMTANVSPEDEQKVLDAGMNRYLNKPVDIHRLLSLVRDVLQK